MSENLIQKPTTGFEKAKDMGIIQELFLFLWENKLWWMIPIMIMIALLIVVMVVGAQSGSAAPFIYTLF
jgi:hypothetical protein